jgi:hypothetical protein
MLTARLTTTPFSTSNYTMDEPEMQVLFLLQKKMGTAAFLLAVA